MFAYNSYIIFLSASFLLYFFYHKNKEENLKINRLSLNSLA